MHGEQPLPALHGSKSKRDGQTHTETTTATLSPRVPATLGEAREAQPTEDKVIGEPGKEQSEQACALGQNLEQAPSGQYRPI